MGFYPSLEHPQPGLNAGVGAGEGAGEASRVAMAGRAGPAGLGCRAAGRAGFQLATGPVGSFTNTPPAARAGCCRLTPCRSAGLALSESGSPFLPLPLCEAAGLRGEAALLPGLHSELQLGKYLPQTFL